LHNTKNSEIHLWWETVITTGNFLLTRQGGLILNNITSSTVSTCPSRFIGIRRAVSFSNSSPFLSGLFDNYFDLTHQILNIGLSNVQNNFIIELKITANESTLC
jgi:hypothetical protein